MAAAFIARYAVEGRRGFPRMAGVGRLFEEEPSRIGRVVLERVVEELRRLGVKAEVSRDPRGVYDIYIGFDDVDKLDELCRRGVLSEEARRLLC